MKIYITILLLIIQTQSPLSTANQLTNRCVEENGLSIGENLNASKIPEDALSAISSIYKKRLKREIMFRNNPIAELAEEVSDIDRDCSCLYRHEETNVLYDNRTDFARALNFSPSHYNCGKQFDVAKLLYLVKKYSKYKPLTIGGEGAELDKLFGASNDPYGGCKPPCESSEITISEEFDYLTRSELRDAQAELTSTVLNKRAHFTQTAKPIYNLANTTIIPVSMLTLLTTIIPTVEPRQRSSAKVVLNKYNNEKFSNDKFSNDKFNNENYNNINNTVNNNTKLSIKANSRQVTKAPVHKKPSRSEGMQGAFKQNRAIATQAKKYKNQKFSLFNKRNEPSIFQNIINKIQNKPTIDDLKQNPTFDEQLNSFRNLESTSIVSKLKQSTKNEQVI